MRCAFITLVIVLTVIFMTANLPEAAADSASDFLKGIFSGSEAKDSKEIKASKNVSTFDIRGIKLGMTIEDIRSLFPKAEIKVDKIIYVTKGFDRKITVLEREEKNTPRSEIEIDIANEQWGHGAIKIKYLSQFSRSSRSEFMQMKNKLIEKYGEPTTERLKTGKKSTPWDACYGLCDYRISACGEYMKIELTYDSLRIELANTCPEKQFEKGTRLNPGNVKF